MYSKIALVVCLSIGITGCRKLSTKQTSSAAQSTASPAEATPTPQSIEVNKKSLPLDIDACVLITKEEAQAIQGSPITETKSSAQSSGGLRVAQCFYSATDFSRSISLAVTQTDPAAPIKRTAREFWNDTFSRYRTEETESPKEELKEKKETGQGREEEERSTPPKKVDGIGEEAFWTANRFGGALYVLKKDVFIRISVGGSDEADIKRKNSVALAQKALDRLP
jgi:hypothetical protein